MNSAPLQIETPIISPIPERMRAGVYRNIGQIGVEDAPVPVITDGEVLLRVAACGICGTDVKKIQHGLVCPPQILGHEIAGTVVKVGSGVQQWKLGDRVVSFHHIPCGECFYCERQLFSQCAVYKKVGVTGGFEPNGGGFAQYVRVMPWIVQRGIVAIPDGVTWDQATFVEPVNTCLKAIHKARVEPDEVVAVIGQGPIGLILAFLAADAGAIVFTSDTLGSRRQMSQRFGAAESFDPAAVNVAAEIRRRNGGIGADAVFLAAPSPKLVPTALSIARPGGRVLLFAQNDPSMQIEFPAAAVGVEEKEILGSYSASVALQEESAQLVFTRGSSFKELVSHRFPLEEIEKAFTIASHPTENSLKVVVLP
jgi:L-iditol 2-dehydrogenase